MTRKFRFPVAARELSLLQIFVNLLASNFVGTGEFSTAVERLGMKLTKHCHLVLKSVSGALLPFHAAYAFMYCIKKVETVTTSSTLITGALGGAVG
jgi:hypothetical protein